MKFDFSQEDFFDNHTHVLDMNKFSVTEEEFLRYYCHGPKFIRENGQPVPSQKALDCLAHQGVILTIVHYLSEFFGCEATLEAVLRERNARTSTPEDLRNYIHSLYENQHIIASTLESELPMGDPLATCIPGKQIRLFRFEDVYDRLMMTEKTYEDMLSKLLEAVTQAVAQGFKGVKGHIAERCGMDVYYVDADRASKQYKAAQTEDALAKREVYYAMFHELLLHCGRLGVPVHIHTGSTGLGKHQGVYKHDPVLMIPFLSSGKYEGTDIVFLHGSYPFTRNAALVAFNFSNIYLDISQTLPWESLGMDAMLEELLALAPHNRLMFGSGQHGCCETAFTAAKCAKAALARVMERITDQDLLSGKQADRSAKLFLSGNALRLYGME